MLSFGDSRRIFLARQAVDMRKGCASLAAMFSIMQSCRLVELDPYRYLVDLFAQLHHGRTDYDQLRPKAWAQRSRSAAA